MFQFWCPGHALVTSKSGLIHKHIVKLARANISFLVPCTRPRLQVRTNDTQTYGKLCLYVVKPVTVQVRTDTQTFRKTYRAKHNCKTYRETAKSDSVGPPATARCSLEQQWDFPLVLQWQPNIAPFVRTGTGTACTCTNLVDTDHGCLVGWVSGSP
jgi:hypothetical protein